MGSPRSRPWRGSLPAIVTSEPGWPAGHDICLEGVHFAYPDGRTILRGIDLRLMPGTLVALVGDSGAGKSTVLWLLLRFGRPDMGRIRVGDVDLDLVDTAVWRSRIGWVPQRPALGSGTISGAIAMGQPDVSADAIVAAATAAHADAFIDRLPKGYETPIGEGGVRLSGGQRQRLALARAFLRDAPILLLDEPTSHLDEVSEEAVAASLRRLAAGRIVLVVSHRRRLVDAAQEVLVLDEGRIVQSGRPRQLTDEDWTVPPPRRADERSGALSVSEDVPNGLATGTPNGSRQMLWLLAPYARWVVIGVLLGSLAIGSAVGLMAASAWLISRAAIVTNVADVALAVTAVRVLAISRAAFRYLERFVTHRASLQILAEPAGVDLPGHRAARSGAPGTSPQWGPPGAHRPRRGHARGPLCPRRRATARGDPGDGPGDDPCGRLRRRARRHRAGGPPRWPAWCFRSSHGDWPATRPGESWPPEGRTMPASWMP